MKLILMKLIWWSQSDEINFAEIHVMKFIDENHFDEIQVDSMHFDEVHFGKIQFVKNNFVQT